MSWNYRIIKHHDLTGDWFGIHEVHYDGKGVASSFAESPAVVIDDPQDKWIVEAIEAAFSRPVLGEDLKVSAGPHD